MVTFFVKDESERFFHPDDEKVWVDIKAELTGHEERKRDELIAKTEARVAQEFSKEELKEARDKAKRRKRTGKDEELEDTSGVMDVIVSTIKAELDMFDLEHYVVSWSFSKPCNRNSFNRLSRDGFNWLLDVIDEHRTNTVFGEEDEKNSPPSSGTTSLTSVSPEDSQKPENPQS